MANQQMPHDPDICHQTSERPQENQQIIINTNAHSNGEINPGYYVKGKWYRSDHSEINEKNIMCWHD